MAERIISSLNNARPAGPCIRSAALAAFQLMGIEGFEVPSWEALADGLRPPSQEPEDTDPGGFKHGWQHEAASRWADHEKALMRSQSGPFAGVALSVAPINFLTRIDPSLFRVLLLRRLRLPLPLSLRSCRCGRPLDPCGHHRQGCWEGVDLRLRARPLGFVGRLEESGCERHGQRLDLALPNAHDARRLEVLVDGLFGGAQLSIDDTLVSPIRGDGTARPGTANINGIIFLAQARRRRAYIPGAGRSPFPCAPCGLGRRGRWQVVGNVLPHFGTRESPIRAANLEEESRAGLEDALGRNPGVHCSRVCRLHPRPPHWRRG